jgi:hypothetical protein
LSAFCPTGGVTANLARDAAMMRSAEQEMRVSLVIQFDRSVAGERPFLLGPFESVELRHRRIGDGHHKIAVRKASGIWAIGGGFLEVRIRSEGIGGRVSLLFSEPWRRGERMLAVSEVTLVGDRLSDGKSGIWIASDQDDGRTWVLEPSGDAYDHLLAA